VLSVTKPLLYLTLPPLSTSPTDSTFRREASSSSTHHHHHQDRHNQPHVLHFPSTSRPPFRLALNISVPESGQPQKIVPRLTARTNCAADWESTTVSWHRTPLIKKVLLFLYLVSVIQQTAHTHAALCPSIPLSILLSPPAALSRPATLRSPPPACRLAVCSLAPPVFLWRPISTVVPPASFQSSRSFSGAPGRAQGLDSSVFKRNGGNGCASA
jgi:hypothetical protein